MSIDASFKEAKHLAQWNGHALYHGLITAMNEFNEVILQFHVISDAHEQYIAPIKVQLHPYLINGS